MKRRIGLFIVALCSILVALIPQLSAAASCTNCFGNNELWSDRFYGRMGTYVADINGDGKADVIAVDSGGITVRRSFAPYTQAFGVSEPMTEEGYYGSIGTYFADVTGDGAADAIAVNTGGITVRRAVYDIFFPNETWTSDPFSGSIGTYFADVTGDGKADAIAVNTGGILVRPSNGTSFTAAQTWAPDRFYGDKGTYVADINGDGKADMIAVNTSGIVVRRSFAPYNQTFGVSEPWIDEPFSGDIGTYFADVTGDGKADAIAVKNGGITVRRAADDTFYPNEIWTSDPFSGDIGTYFADVTGDGKADAIAINTGGITVRRSYGRP